MSRIRAFIDTNMMKYAADELPRLSPRTQHIQWGRVEQDVIVYDPVVVRPGESFDPKLASEVARLPLIAFLARSGRLELLSHAEAEIELWGLKDVQDPRGRFYGAPITNVPDPVTYGRIVLSGVPDILPPLRTTKPSPEHKHRQAAFIADLTHPRLLALRHACGADTATGINANQIIDAFHLWCAETGGATHFLTAEKRLLALAAPPFLR